MYSNPLHHSDSGSKFPNFSIINTRQLLIFLIPVILVAIAVVALLGQELPPLQDGVDAL